MYLCRQNDVFMHKILTFDNAEARIFGFDGGTEVEEFHLVLSVTNPMLPYREQLEAIFSAYNEAKSCLTSGAEPVFKRYFLSDASNQIELLTIRETESTYCAVSIIQQPPLNGTKLALWAYLTTNMERKRLENGLFEARHGAYRHLWLANACDTSENSETQTRILLENYVQHLENEGVSLADNCVRTWFFVNEVDLNYAGVVKARNEVFATQNLTDQTHFIASTGIGGRQADAQVLAQMDAYAIDGIQQAQIGFLYAPTHLNRTSDYGVAFERGTFVDYGDRHHVFISGTASIDNKGEIVHHGDVVAQCRRMWENVEALLAEADCSFADAAQMIVYLRDPADYSTIKKLFEERFPEKPWVIVHGKVCRPGWLIEMEMMAIKAQKTEFPEL